MKYNLPVIILKGIILLPHNEIRLEFDNDESKNILDISEMFHDKRILVVCSNNGLEETIRQDQLPRIGISAKITNKMELPNGKIRVILTGLKRVSIYEYLNFSQTNEVLESIVENIKVPEISEKEQEILGQKLYRELENYINHVPYMSNSVLSTIHGIKKISAVVDIIAPYLPISIDRLYLYYNEPDPKVRFTYLLEDIYEQQRIFDIEKEIDNKIQDELNQNHKNYILKEKMRLIKEELGEGEEEEIKLRIDKLEAPKKIKNRLMNEYNHYSKLQPMSPEANIIKTYIDWFLALPWMEKTEDNQDLNRVKDLLNQKHAGLEQVKKRILEFLAVKQRAGDKHSPILCLIGPPGVGKTTLAYSIAEAMNRNFVKISVGGMYDDSEIMGHRRTYLGANPGRIIQSMKKAGSINPVFLIDEIDKMSSGIHGDPASSLLEVLDPTQNKFFSDHYIEEEYDLSNVMFITTANYIEDIPEALLDRLELIELSGYTELEKVEIVKTYLLPEVCRTHGLDRDQIVISDDTIKSLIQDYTREAGVRELKRQIETLVRKIVTEIVMGEIEKTQFHITRKIMADYLGKCKYPKIDSNSESIGVVNGLAYTSYGGDTLAIEVNYYEGSGNLVLTGSLGDVMKESAQIAFSYLKASAKKYNISYEMLTKNDIHIHVPEGAIKKDGPSAGIALTTALISAFTNKKVSREIAMTGEITLRGKVLPIGGLKEKSMGAIRSGVKDIIIPFDNKNDIEEIPKEIRQKLKYHYVKEYDEVFNFVFSK